MQDRGLGDVERIYRPWGHHPRLYAAQDAITFLGRHRAIRRRAVAAMEVGAGARVLEVACGTGRNFPHLEEAIGAGGTLVGFDYSAAMLASARALADRRGYHNVELVEGDAAVLEVGDEPFCGVLCVLGFSAMPGHLAALRRCWQVLRPGGWLAVCDARPFSGALAALNPLVRALYVPTTGWNPDRDVAADMQRVFGNVAVDAFNAGTLFVARSQRRAPAPE